MELHHQLLGGVGYLLKGIRTIGAPLGLARGPALRVLVYHDVAPAQEGHFAAQLRWLARDWKFVSPEQFAAMVSGDEPINGRNLLLTFDDGFASNRQVAERVLNPMGIRALFFVVSDFVSIPDSKSALEFIARHIYPVSSAAMLPQNWSNMGWSDLEVLLEQGHCIGAHTRTHARLSQINDLAALENEIIGGADTLSDRLGIPIEHFAYTFGDLDSFSPEAMQVARRRFRFVHSGLRGNNVGTSPWAIRRDAVGAQQSLALLNAFLEGAADFRYASARSRLATWIPVGS